MIRPAASVLAAAAAAAAVVVAATFGITGAVGVIPALAGIEATVPTVAHNDRIWLQAAVAAPLSRIDLMARHGAAA